MINNNDTKEFTDEEKKWLDDIWSIDEAPKSILSSLRFLLEAVKENDEALKYAPAELKNDKDLVLELVRINGNVLAYASFDLRKDKKIVSEAVKQTGEAMKYASRELKDDHEFALQAVKDNGWAFEYISAEFRKDKEFVKEAIKTSSFLIQSASEEIQEDKEFLLDIIKHSSSALSAVSNELKNDKEFMRKVLKNDISLLAYASDELKNDDEFIQEVNKLNNSNKVLNIKCKEPSGKYIFGELSIEDIKELQASLHDDEAFKQTNMDKDYEEYDNLGRIWGIDRKFATNDSGLTVVKELKANYVTKKGKELQVPQNDDGSLKDGLYILITEVSPVNLEFELNVSEKDFDINKLTIEYQDINFEQISHAFGPVVASIISDIEYDGESYKDNMYESMYQGVSTTEKTIFQVNDGDYNVIVQAEGNNITWISDIR